MTAQPTRFTMERNSSRPIAVRMPGMLSILSTVPPVCPSPRPLIFATFTPHDAAIGTITRLVLSPTPPVECLSTVTPSTPERSTVSPECAIARVSRAVSRAVIP